MGFQLTGEIARGFGVGDAVHEELRRRLAASYPGAPEGATVMSWGTRGDGESIMTITWKDRDGRPLPLGRIARPLGGAAPSYLWPALNTERDTLAPLPCWWAILLALSTVARYQPECWRALLARDKSRAAIPIEQSLERARATLPWMLNRALTRDLG